MTGTVEKRRKSIVFQAHTWAHTISLLIMSCIIIIFSKIFQEGLVFSGIYITAALIIIIADVLNNYASKTKTMNTAAINQITAANKVLAYAILIVLFLLQPPGAPVNFLLPLLASLDYYFIIGAWLVAGSLLALWTVLSIFLEPQNQL